MRNARCKRKKSSDKIMQKILNQSKIVLKNPTEYRLHACEINEKNVITTEKNARTNRKHNKKWCSNIIYNNFIPFVIYFLYSYIFPAFLNQFKSCSNLFEKNWKSKMADSKWRTFWHVWRSVTSWLAHDYN
jgi:hypothetical protein